MAFGNVNVSYKPCKSVGQLKPAEKYMLGKKPDQTKNGIIKTEPDLYMALGCNRDNFSNNVLVTRKDGNAAITSALITGDSAEHTIFDALEILKHLVNMPSKVEN